jgi:predicted transcriptional regulator
MGSDFNALAWLGKVISRAGTIYALAKHLGRNYSNVHADTTRLLDLGLVEKNAEGRVWVPWDEIQIRVTLGGRRAA